jgi:hypothetical protein
MTEEILRNRMRFHLEAASAYAEELHDARTQRAVDDLRRDIPPPKNPPRSAKK